MMQSRNVTTLPLLHNDVKDTWLHTFCELKDDIVKAIREPKQEVFAINTPSQNQVIAPLQVPRSNTWCGKCHGYGHLASECPTQTRLVPDQVRSLFCTYCLRNNHTKDQCFVKQAHERRKVRNAQTNFNFMDRNNMTYEIGPPPQPFMQGGIPEDYL